MFMCGLCVTKVWWVYSYIYTHTVSVNRKNIKLDIYITSNSIGIRGLSPPKGYMYTVLSVWFTLVFRLTLVFRCHCIECGVKGREHVTTVLLHVYRVASEVLSLHILSVLLKGYNVRIFMILMLIDFWVWSQ